MDDIILTGDNAIMVQQLISSLASRFSLKDMGPLTYFLGAEVHHDKSRLILSQTKYILKLLHDLSMHESELYSKFTAQ
jgi:hypothetical protein